MSFDGCPTDLQSLRSKICFFSLKSWTLTLKTDFSIYKPVKIGPQAHQFGAWVLKNVFPIWKIRRPNAPIWGPIFLRMNIITGAWNSGPKCSNSGPELAFCWKSEILVFFALSALIILINDPKKKYKVFHYYV